MGRPKKNVSSEVMSERVYNVKRLARISTISYNPEKINTFIDETLVFSKDVEKNLESASVSNKKLPIEKRMKKNMIINLIDTKLKLINEYIKSINNKNELILEYYLERDRFRRLNSARSKRYVAKKRLRLDMCIHKLYKFDNINKNNKNNKRINEKINKKFNKKINDINDLNENNCAIFNIPTERQCKILEKKEAERLKHLQKTMQEPIMNDEEYPLSPEYNINLRNKDFYIDYKIEDKIDIDIKNYLYDVFSNTSTNNIIHNKLDWNGNLDTIDFDMNILE
jgi:hypothetical protein